MSKYIRITGIFVLCAFTLSMGATSAAFAESPKQYVDDASITAKVKHAIFADPLLRLFQIRVSTNDNVVLLKGNIDSVEQEAEAVKIAGQIKDVVSVIDHLNVEVASEE